MSMKPNHEMKHAQTHRIATYVSDERHIYTGPKHRRRSEALKDLAQLDDAISEAQQRIAELEALNEALEAENEMLQLDNDAIEGYRKQVVKQAEENARLREELEAVYAGDPIVPCGDNSCLLDTTTGGMRTNGGCRCFASIPSATYRRKLQNAVQRRINAARSNALEES